MGQQRCPGGFGDTLTLSADPSGWGSHIAQPIYVAAVNFQLPLQSCRVDGRWAGGDEHDEVYWLHFDRVKLCLILKSIK